MSGVLRLCAALLVTSTLASAAPLPAFREHHLEGFRIQTREVARGTMEVIADGVLDASAEDLEDVLTGVEFHPRFMPYVKESRVLERGGEVVKSYIRLQFSLLIEPRDYVLETRVLQSAKDGNTFRSSWRSIPDALPERDGVVRVRVNEGEWTVRADAPQRSHVTYRFVVNPGGALPSFAADFAQREGVLKLFNAVEREANDRAFRKRAYRRLEAPRR